MERVSRVASLAVASHPVSTFSTTAARPCVPRRPSVPGPSATPSGRAPGPCRAASDRVEPLPPGSRLERHHHHDLRQPDDRHLRRRPAANASVRNTCPTVAVAPTPSSCQQHVASRRAGRSRSVRSKARNAAAQNSVETAEKWTTIAERGRRPRSRFSPSMATAVNTDAARAAHAASGNPPEVRLLRQRDPGDRGQRPPPTPRPSAAPRPSATTGSPPRSGTCSSGSARRTRGRWVRA